MPIPVTRGAEFGPCNICGEVGKLTEDHTPPKGCVRPTEMMIQFSKDRLGVHKTDGRGRISQNGVKFRTICTRCNSGLLGTRYDPVLIEFANYVAGFLGRTLAVPMRTSVPTKPALLMRAVFGHISAHGVDRYLKGPRTEKWRSFFLDEALPPPPGIRFLYWIYPYRRIALVNGAATMDLERRGHAVWSLMKFYPLAFAIVDPVGSFSYPFHDLAAFRVNAPEDEIYVPLELYPVPNEYEVEAPRGTQAILYSRDALMAEEREAKGRLLNLTVPKPET